MEAQVDQDMQCTFRRALRVLSAEQCPLFIQEIIAQLVQAINSNERILAPLLIVGYLTEPAKKQESINSRGFFVGTVLQILCKRTEKQRHGDHLEKPQSRCSRKIFISL